MSSHSGTIGRSRGLSVGSQIRRQRSVEWRHEHGYSSSEDDERIGRGSINPSFDSQLLAQLIAQSQQLSSKLLFCQQRFHSIRKCYLFSLRILDMTFSIFILLPVRIGNESNK